METTVSLRNQQREFTRARFINAALDEFQEVGFDNATIDMITCKAGTNRSTFYLHFKDKVDLLLAAHEQLDPSGDAVFERINNMIEPDYVEFRRWIDFLAQLWVDNREVYGAIMHAQLTEPRFAKVAYDQKLGFLTPYLNRFKATEREDGAARAEMFLMQFERYFYTTICVCLNKPEPAVLDSLAKLGYYALFNRTA